MPRKILIVDDNAINREMLINVLQDDYDIIEADDGKKALSLMHRHYKTLSAVLMDIVMPEMNGYDVLKSVRDNVLLSQIPIIMVTGSEDEDSRVKALSLGANDFILKPFNPEIVKHCLRNNIALRETASILNAIQRDKLTGLYNREAFFEKAGSMIKDREPGFYILSSFDIDNFKLINDQYGAIEGDRILKEIGNTIRACMDSVGGMGGRISADNFAALFPATEDDTNIIKCLQDKKLSALEQRVIVLSVGRYLVMDTLLPASAIYDRAYLAKQSVKGRYDKHLAYFDETMLQKLIMDQQIISDMETALTEKQFEVWFQPQYNHVNGALIGAEALVRWRHPQKGIIPPGEFIPLFEQNGFIYELDKYVWREACCYLRKWIDEGMDPPPISVNISRYDIFRADLIGVITDIVREYRIPIDMLRLEVTESAFAKSTKLIVDIVKKLVNLGFTIEIDDFGSGYSSLNTLKSVPAQVVKLDMRFLEDGDDGQRGGNILESIVRMTKWLGMSVIAEGVETKEQGDFLKSIGCSHVQGYLYARPMPAKEYEAHCQGVKKEHRFMVLETAGNLNNNDFWNPESMDTLIFNSYVGSACIYEYHNGNIELLRVTDQYARMLGGDSMTVDQLLRIELDRYIDRDSAAKVIAAINESIHKKAEVTGEFLFLDLPGCPHETYLRSTMRVIANVDDRYLLYCISENITSQRMLERKERKTAKQLQSILDNINCGITAVRLHDRQIQFLLANDKYYGLLGYTRAQFLAEIGDKVYTLVYEEDRRRVIDITERTMNSGVPSSMEFRVVRRDGTLAWIRSFLSMTTFEDVEGQVQLCTYADITAERHTAQNLLDNLPCGAGICVVNENDARMTYLNRRYLSYFNHVEDMYRASSVFSVIHPEDREMLRSIMRPALNMGGEGSCVIRIMDGPNEYKPFRVSGLAAKSNGDDNAIYVTFVPISHEELSFQEMLPMALEKMMESSSDLSFVKDKNLRYICCSRAFAQMVGLDSEKAVAGKTDYDLFEKQFADQYTFDDKALLKDGNSIIERVESLPSFDGRERYSCTSKYPLTDSFGNIIGLYGSGHDITNTREWETRQKFLINNIPGGIAIYEGNWSDLKTIRLTYFSDGFCRLFGYTRKEYEKLSQTNPMGLIVKEYLPGLMKQIEALIQDGSMIDYIYRADAKDSAYRWIHLKALPGERTGECMTVNAILFDITEHQEALERLRVSEEENRLAIQHSENVVCRYNVANKRLRISSSVNPIFEMGAFAEDVPYGEVKSGRVSPETADAYIGLYEGIRNGRASDSIIYQRKSKLGWRWIKADSSTIFSSDGKPVSAVISFFDVTDNFEKDVAYRKWMQSLHNKSPESYSLFQCNITKRTVFDTVQGSLLNVHPASGSFLLDEYMKTYLDQCVLDEDKERYRAFMEIDSLYAKYRRGERIVSIEYREKLPESGYRWIKLTADLVEYPHTTDVEAYLLFENIDEVKRSELLTIARAETDPLTGVLNRTTFAEKVNECIRVSKNDAQHALLMLDIDGFKLVNDAFGHDSGDQTLIDIAGLLRTILRGGDLVGRLGGDEFVIFITDIPEARVAADKAKRICEMTRKTYTPEVQISGSVGISLYPHDGCDFETLYKKADDTLYHVKGLGRDNYAFYHEDIRDEHLSSSSDADISVSGGTNEKKRRMLIVDDSKIDHALLANIFRNEFIIEKAKDGNAALIRLRHYGSAISVVLLDLLMPGMDGFAVLNKMQQSPEMRSIPVIVVSAADDRETSLRAIRAGASDFVMKPVDTEVLRIRVMSAISKAENEKLRLKNSFLEMQSAEMCLYQTVLEKMNLAIVAMDWGTSNFQYSPSISAVIGGNFDGRTLWHVFLSDIVTDALTVRSIQQLVHDTAEDRTRTEGKLKAKLKTPSGKRHWFDVHVYKKSNEYGLADKIIITFSDTDAFGGGEEHK